MRRPVGWIPIAVIGALAGCGNGDDNAAAVSIVDAAAADAAIPPSAVRVANWASDLSPSAVDVCLSAPGMDLFQGPVLAAAYGSLDGGAMADAGVVGVSFMQVSADVPVAPGPYDVRVVSAGAPDCTQGIALDLRSAGPFATGTVTTVAILGLQNGADPATSLSVLALGDDSVVASTKAAVRFINALPSLPSSDPASLDAPIVDFGTGVAGDSGLSSSFKPIYVGVPFGGVSDKTETQVPTLAATASVDGRGYGSIAPVLDTIFTAHVSGTTFDIANATANIAGGAAVTAVLLPRSCESAEGGCPYPAQLALYVDNAGTVGRFASCITCP